MPTPTNPFEFKIPNPAALLDFLGGHGQLFPSADVRRRYQCVALAVHVAPKGSTVYDCAALADYLDRGHDAMADEPAPCSCNQPDAEHERGDSAFCSMAAE